MKNSSIDHPLLDKVLSWHSRNRYQHYLNTYLHHILLALLLLSLTVIFSSASAAQYEIEINKSKQELLVKESDRIVKRFHAAYGRGGKGTKQRLGDKKTPVGIYKIMQFKSDSKFHFFMQLDYPNLLDAWSGYKNQLISAGEFKSIASAYKNKESPPQNTVLGGYIGIHGLGIENEEKLLIHESTNWTEGCIALTNSEIMELRKYVDIGTRVVIKE